MPQSAPQNRDQIRLAIRDNFPGHTLETHGWGLQLEGVWCQGGSVLSHVCRTPAPFVCYHGRPHLLPADLGGPMVEATVGTPSGSCPGRQVGNKESAAPAMET